MEEKQEKSRIDRQFDFIREIDKEKFITRQTFLSDAKRRENDAEHAWHMAIMTLLLSEYANRRQCGRMGSYRRDGRRFRP